MKQVLQAALTKWPHCIATYAGLLLLAALLFFRSSPPILPIETHAVADPLQAATEHAARVGGRPLRVAFTGSMRPHLHGGEVVVAVADYGAIQAGSVVCYEGQMGDGVTRMIIHRAVQKDKGGWIMSGDNNAVSETWQRVVPANYLGTVIAIYLQQ